jgi:acyl-coenzyme A thioesterase PaaI-like protein
MMKQQGSATNCFVCGVRNDTGLQIRFFETESSPVRVTAEYTVPSRYEGYPGVVHGGIIASMLDEVTSRTIFRGEPLRFVVTARLNIRYRKPVPIETPLRLNGWIVEDKGKVITVAGEMLGPGDVLLAEAEAVLVEVDPSFFGEALTEDAWQTHPDGSGQPDGIQEGNHDH